MTDPFHRIFETLGEIQADQRAMKEDISEIKTGVQDYKTTKAKLIGWCVGIAAATGGSVSAALNKMGIHL